MSVSRFGRGSEWRQWDLHVHTPASFQWNGRKFSRDPNAAANTALIDEMIDALKSAEPSVFALMDYWTFDGWFALKRRLIETTAPKLAKTVFPGIELRLAAPTTCRLNAHVLFSDEVADQTLLDFRAGLQVEVVSRPLSNASLIELARIVGEDKLRRHGFNKAEIDSDDERALLAGATIAEINCDSYKAAIKNVPNAQAIGVMPYDTSDGLAEVKWQDHYAYFLGLFGASPIFESRNLDLRGAFVNEVTPGNESWIRHFQTGLQQIPRLVVSGSDAHRFKGVSGDNNKRGYGDFPSGKATWIKADPTFFGLRQAIKEPAKRSHIGARPDKLVEVDQNKTFFIDKIEVRKNASSTLQEKWLSDCNLLLNSDLVAIIGNKGSGKSALADVIALLGNSKQQKYFSFLTNKRFRAKPKELAKHFTGQMTWCDGATDGALLLSDDPEPTSVELVRYIPQLHFENLCNDHVSGLSDVFENELRDVIFSHTDAAIRQKASDFTQLIEQQESGLRDQLNEFRKDLKRLNVEIESTEARLQPGVRKALEELLDLKRKQIDEHKKITPEMEPKPSEELSPEQQSAAANLEAIAVRLKSLDESERATSLANAELAIKTTSLQSVRERLRILRRQFEQFKDETANDGQILGLDLSKLIELKIDEETLNAVAANLPNERNSLSAKAQVDATERQKLSEERAKLQAALNEPQLKYQESLKRLDAWQIKLGELIGSSDIPDSLEGLQARLGQLDQLPATLALEQANRFAIAGEIFDILEAQRKARETLFAPVQDLIRSNALIRDDYKLQFQATLGGSSDALAAPLFALIKQNSGEFRGEEESHSVVRKIAEKLDFSKKAEALQFVSELHDKIVSTANDGDRFGIGIAQLVRVGKSQSGTNKSPATYMTFYLVSLSSSRATPCCSKTQRLNSYPRGNVAHCY